MCLLIQHKELNSNLLFSALVEMSKKDVFGFSGYHCHEDLDG